MRRGQERRCSWIQIDGLFKSELAKTSVEELETVPSAIQIVKDYADYLAVQDKGLEEIEQNWYSIWRGLFGEQDNRGYFPIERSERLLTLLRMTSKDEINDQRNRYGHQQNALYEADSVDLVDLCILFDKWHESNKDVVELYHTFGLGRRRWCRPQWKN